jgi:hypothetical protein
MARNNPNAKRKYRGPRKYAPVRQAYEKGLLEGRQESKERLREVSQIVTRVSEGIDTVAKELAILRIEFKDKEVV